MGIQKIVTPCSKFADFIFALEIGFVVLMFSPSIFVCSWCCLEKSFDFNVLLRL